MENIDSFKAELRNQSLRIEAMIVLLDANRPDLIRPLWDELSGWIELIDMGLETGEIHFR